MGKQDSKVEMENSINVFKYFQLFKSETSRMLLNGNGLLINTILSNTLAIFNSDVSFSKVI